MPSINFLNERAHLNHTKRARKIYEEVKLNKKKRKENTKRDVKRREKGKD